jgi:hypothetical protein
LTLILIPLVLGSSLAVHQGLYGQDRKPAQSPAAKDQNKTPLRQPQAWKLDEAMTQLTLNPKDPYLQYVVLQLARRDNRLEEIAPLVEQMVWGRQIRGTGRANQVDLFSIFTGALAVQESLQLDTMRGDAARRGRPRGAPLPPLELPAPPKPPEVKEPQGPVAVASLKGPTIQSHPWEKLLGAKRPDISPLARLVPEDFYFAEFHSFTKLLDALDLSALGVAHLFDQASRDARSQLAGERLKKQLAVETSRWSRLVGDEVINELAVTGSDLFYGEGSDVTLLFRLKQPEVFKGALEGMLNRAEKARSDARRSEGTFQGVPFIHLATPDRDICVYTAYPRPDLHVRSNSKVAFQHILAAVQGKQADGKAVRTLGDSLEFAYIRTLMPRGAKEEDGFIYLSDPFIRRVVGPQLKLTERRRMLCYNHLRMINHASLMYRTEFGKAPTSLAELADTRCAPGLFGEGQLTCPDGGKYTLSADGETGVCSHHGHSHFLTPCCEVPVAQVTADEAKEYKAFLDEYNQYWRTYFDPIALRLQITPERYRMETIVLPLINNTVYQTVAQSLGGKPEPLDSLPVPKRNIFSVAFRFNKEGLMELGGFSESKLPPNAKQLGEIDEKLSQIGIACHNYHDTHGHFPTAASYDKDGKPLLSWRVHLLPFLDGEALYNEFHLDEPWDSDHNKKLIDRIPAVYRANSDRPDLKVKTRFVVPVGEATMFPGSKPLRFSDVLDGTSYTILLAEADDAHAVIWTKPEDLKYDPKRPQAGLTGTHPEGFLTVFVDGSVHYLRNTIDAKTLQALFTPNGGEVVELGPRDEVENPHQRRRSFLTDIPGVSAEEIASLQLEKFLTKGIGNQVGLHVYDGIPLFDFDLAGFFGMMLGSFNGRAPAEDVSMVLPAGFLVSALNSPVYISIPVQDAKIVDDFLTALDKVLPGVARRHRIDEGWIRVENGFYQFQHDPKQVVRCYSVQLWAFKWRVFWARIGNGLYIASKPFILEDLAAAAAAGTPADQGPVGHGMIRMRPKNWNQVLTDYRLGWAENNRDACLNNLGPLASVGRAFLPGAGEDAQANARVLREADKLYGVHFFCPEGGRYTLSPDGKRCQCSVHGSMDSPHQAAGPAENGTTGKLLKNFTGLTATLTFLEDGLHAVVTIDRK